MASLVFREGKDGKLFAYYVVTQNGKKRWFSRGLVQNRKFAEQEFRVWERQVDRDKFFKITPPSPSLQAFTPQYFEYAKGRTLTGEGIVRAESSLKHLNRVLGKMKLADIVPAVVDNYVTQRKAEQCGRTKRLYAPKTINNEVVQLSSVMEAAIRLNALENHPYKTPKRTLSSYFLKTERKIPTVLFPEEIKAMLEVAKENAHNLSVFMFLLLTGMRKGELAGLKWEHVNFSRKLITFGSPKTDDFRTIPLSDVLVDLLTHMRTYWPEPLGHKAWIPRKQAQMTYVFCDIEGNAFNREMGGFLKRLAIKAGISKKVTPHVLRHSFAAYGRSQYTVFQLQKLLGHRNISTTERYGILLEAGMTEGSNKVAESMGLGGALGFKDQVRSKEEQESYAPKRLALPE